MVFVSWPAQVVDHGDTSARRQRGIDEGEELPHPLVGHMAQPEREEHVVEASRRRPPEQVIDHEVDRRGVVRVGQFGASGVEGLGRRVDGGDAFGMASQLDGPVAGAGGQFEHVTGGTESVEPRHRLVDLGPPLPLELGAFVVATLTPPPLVVLGRSGPVVGDLFGHPLVGHCAV